MTVESALAEWQVRIAAQRILSENLTAARTASSTSGWRDIDVDLSGAALFDFDFRQCVARRARFRACRFYGVARFYEATFAEGGEFDGAEFFGPAWFGSVRFKGNAWFGGAHFHRVADFHAAAFEGVASFGGRNAWLGFAVFAGDTNLGEAAFATPPRMEDVRFKEIVGEVYDRTWPEGWSASPDPDDPDGNWKLLRAVS
jgi:hypothetical protein